MAAPPIIFITGANTGIGYEAVKAFMASPEAYHIILGSRSVSKGEEAIKNLKDEFPSSKTTLELVQIDVASDESIDAAYKKISAGHDHIDALVNNAGAMFDHWLGKNDGSIRDTFTKAFNVNTAGAHVVTYTFAPLLLRSKAKNPRLLFITSGMSSLEGAAPTFTPTANAHQFRVSQGWPKAEGLLPMGYRVSKAGLNMAMLGWHHQLSGDGVKTFALSPGFLATGLGGTKERMAAMGAGAAPLGGQFIKQVVDGERDEEAGKVITRFGVQAW